MMNQPMRLHIQLLVQALLLLLSSSNHHVVMIHAQSFGDRCPSCPAGEFCGTDNTCHKWTCQTFYEFGDPALTGYGSTGSIIPLTCYGVSSGKDLHLHAVVFGCKSVFPGSPMVVGQSVSETYNSRCSAVSETLGSYLKFDCYELRTYANDLVSDGGLPYNDNADEKTHNFRFFTQGADSLFPTCENSAQPQFYYPIASTSRYTSDVEGLLGNAIVSSGSSPSGDTTWQENPTRDFSEALALGTIYANVTIQKPGGSDKPPTDFMAGASGSGGGTSGGGASASSAPPPAILAAMPLVCRILAVGGLVSGLAIVMW